MFKGTAPTTRVKHNLADNIQYELVLRSLGGEKLLKQKYPEMYKILLYTRDKQIKNANETVALRAPLDNEYTYGLEDSMKIRTLNYDPATTLESVSSINTVHKNPSLIIVGELKDITHNKAIDGFAVYDSNSQYLDGEINCKSVSLIKDTEYEFMAKSTFSKIEYDESGNPFYSSLTDVTDAKKVVAASTLVKNITVNAPDSIKHPGAARTVIYYNNRTGSGCDYYYNNVKADSNSVEVYIPFNGSVEFANGFKPSYVDKNLDFMLQIVTAKSGVANFNTAHWNEIEWTLNNSSLSWKFPDCWYDILQKNNFDSANDVNFYCKMSVVLEGGIAVPIVISSEDREHKDPSFKKIKAINIAWGCFAKGSRIKMSDNTLKNIEDLKVGDKVKTENGCAAVIETIVGSEEKMILIRASNGCKLTITDDHPVMTEAGWKTAGDLSAADIIKTETGLSGIEELHYVNYRDKVFSVRLETESDLISEGIYTGDFGCQNRLKTVSKNSSDVKKEEFQQELEELISSINNDMRRTL